MEKTADYRPLINEVRRSESVTSAEFLSRFALIATGCAIGWLGLGLELLPYWLTAYYGAVFAEKYLLLQYPEARTRGFMATLAAISLVISSAFFALPVYLWFLPDDVWKFAAAILLVTGCVNIFQLRSRVLPVTIAYFLPMGAAFFIMATDFWLPPEGGVAFWAAFALAVLVASYFALCVIEAQKANSRVLRTQTQLVQSQKIEALEALASGISQDFRNVLSVIQGNLELLQEGPDAADRQACIRDAMEGVRRGSHLTAQLALYSRPACATVCAVDPIKVIDDVHRMARHVLPSTICLHVQTPSTMDHLHIDESALQATLLNLVVHARDATGGTGAISLETYITEQAREPGRPRRGTLVVFEIGETGSDGTTGTRPSVDDAGFAPSPDPRRNGLALATARSFAEHSGGEFRIDYGRDRGSRLILLLPV